MSKRRMSFASRRHLNWYALALVAAVGGLGVEVAGCGARGDDTGGTGNEAVGEPSAPKSALPGFVRLERGTQPMARLENEVGPLPLEKRLENLSVVFKLTPEQLQDREALKDAQLDPASPSYHQWLTPEQYAARFGASADTIARTKAWLASQGLEVGEVSPLGARVNFAGTVAKVQEAFRTEMRQYRVGDKLHYAMSSAPAVPSELADAILAIHNTHDFYPRPAFHGFQVAPDATCPAGDPYCKANGLAPPDWANIYDVTKLYAGGVSGTPIDGTGVTIAIVGVADIAQSDLNAFRTRYGLPAATITKTLVPNTGAAQGANGAGIEAILDTEWAQGIAKKASINYVFTGANDGNVDDATYYAIEHNVAPILSESWGGCEANLTAADADVVETLGSAANLEGMTYLAASGDSGAAGCIRGNLGGLYVGIPAAYPGVTSVGGTEFPTGSLTFTGGTATGYSTSEEVWNESNNPNAQGGVGAGGGGISILFPRPAYQSTTPTCTMVGSFPVSGITAANMREVPDISFAAAGQNNGIFIECTVDAAAGDCSATGGAPVVIPIAGTSASTPAFAGVVALMNQLAGGRLGNVNPLLYALNKSSPTAFHDIKTGNNEVQCTPGTDPGCATSKLYGYASATGFDCTTGLGSLDVANMMTAWNGSAATATALTTTPSSTSEGADISLDATITVPKPNGSALTGVVTFQFESYLANGNLDLSWTVGTASITGASANGATATVSAPIPPGLANKGAQFVDVSAIYNGDAHHLSSVSAKSRITFSPVSLCLAPGTSSVSAGATLAFTATGNDGAVRWYTRVDTTCDVNNQNCSNIDAATGAFTAGTGAPGWVLVQVVDANGAEALAEVTVGSPTGTPPWAGDSGILVGTCPTVTDAGTDSGNTTDAGTDSGTILDAGHDSGTTIDAGTDSGATSDAGHDSGSGGNVDSGSDSGSTGNDSGTIGNGDASTGNDSGSTGSDSGSTGDDSGSTADSSTGDDSGSTGGDDSGGIPKPDDSGTTGGNDSGSPVLTDSGSNIPDTGAGTQPGGGGDSGDEDGGSGSGSGSSGGCGCTTAGSENGSQSGMFAAAALGLGLMVRRRRKSDRK